MTPVWPVWIPEAGIKQSIPC